MTKELVDEVLWHVEQVCGPLSTKVCVVEGDDDRSVLAHNVRAILARQRNEGIEAAAGVAHDHRFEQCGRHTEELCSKIATAIRALKEPE